MDVKALAGRFSNQRVLLIVTVCFLVGAFVLSHWQERLSASLEGVRNDYQVDVELSKHKAEHMQAYQTIISQAKLPQGEPLAPNPWIQATQALVVDQKLSLQELKPSTAGRRKDDKRAGLFLIAEGRVSEFVSFLHKIANANDFVYVERTKASRSAEDSELIRAQMTLLQTEG